MPFSIATWNINSVRLRMPIVERLLIEHAPDVLCLQETKVPDELFPEKAFRKLGYEHIAFHGQKGYHGVATVARRPIEVVEKRRFCEIEDSRHLSITVRAGGKAILLHNFYVPAGGDEPDPEINPKFRHKLDFVDEMNAIRAEHDEASGSILVGDLNIAPLEHDVWSHKQLLERGQPHAGRDGKLRGDAAGRRLGRPDAAQRSARAEALHLVELSRPGLGAVQSRPAARPCLVVA